MYRKMNYEDIYEWAKDKITSKHSSSIKFESEISLPFYSSEDAVKELVMETCDDVSRIPMCEMQDKQSYLDEIERLKREIANLKANETEAFNYLQKAYDSYVYWMHSLKNYMEEILDGRKSVRDLKESDLWEYPPQTYEYIRCAENLGKQLKDKNN